MRIRTLSALLIAGLLAGCNGGTPAPSGWQPVPGASPGLWSTGSGDALQTYGYERTGFSGTLQELVTQQMTAVAANNKGARFDGSDVFAPCPGQAALVTFSDGNLRVLIRGVALQGGTSVLVTYVRPKSTAMDPAVATAFEKALCFSP